ncbi:MAG: PKD domain-containing protein [Candidatus Peribacteraceae bacterium]|nr:PKD domain-containing protein [Candidatus Peribacteraceae bacterium]
MSLCVLPATVWGQASALPSLTIRSGQTIELTVDTSIDQPDFSWILTKDRTFINAQRGRFFQTRQTVAGTYTLDINIQDQSRTRTEYYTFHITVADTPDLQTFPSGSGNQLQAVLSTSPDVQAGYIHVPSEGGFVMFDGRQSLGNITQYNLDLQNTVDSNGDGKFDNDFDTIGTYSQQSGSPLAIFVRPLTSSRAVTLHVQDSFGNTAMQQVRIAFDGTALSVPQPEKSGSFTIERSGLTAGFVSDVPMNLLQNYQLLYEWDFGDNAKSLLDAPTHTYSQPGQYTVSLVVRDLATTQPLFSDSQTITLSISSAPVSSTASSVASPSISSSATTNPSSSFSFGSIGNYVKVGLIIFFIVSIGLILFALLSWIKRMTTGRLQQTLEKVEDNLFKPEKKADVVEAVSVMPLKRETVSVPSQSVSESVIQNETSKTEFRSKDRDNSVPLASSGPVPAWLNNTPTAPVEDAVTSNKSEPLAPQPNLEESVPDWLKPDAVAPVTTGQVTAANPVVDAVTSEPVPETRSDAPVPDWLKTASAHSEKSSDTSSVPTPTSVAASEVDDLTGLNETMLSDPQATAEWAMEPDKQKNESENREEAEVSVPEPDDSQNLIADVADAPSNTEPPRQSAPQTAPALPKPEQVVAAPSVKPPVQPTGQQKTYQAGPNPMPRPNGTQIPGQPQNPPTGLSASQKRKRRRKKKQAALQNPGTLGTSPAAPIIPVIKPAIDSPSLPKPAPATPSKVFEPQTVKPVQPVAVASSPPVIAQSTAMTPAATPIADQQTKVPDANPPLTPSAVQQTAQPVPEVMKPDVAPPVSASPIEPVKESPGQPVITKPIAQVNTPFVQSESPTAPPALDVPKEVAAAKPDSVNENDLQRQPDDTPIAIIRADSI